MTKGRWYWKQVQNFNYEWIKGGPGEENGKNEREY